MRSSPDGRWPGGLFALAIVLASGCQGDSSMPTESEPAPAAPAPPAASAVARDPTAATPLAPAAGADVPGADPELAGVEEELDTLSRELEVEDSRARLELSRRLQATLGRIAALAVREERPLAGARRLLAATLVRPQERLAVEAAYALIATQRPEGATLLLGALPGMGPGVRRHALEVLRVQGPPPERLAAPLLTALKAEEDPDAFGLLASMVGTLPALTAARGLLEAAPSLDALDRAARPDATGLDLRWKEAWKTLLEVLEALPEGAIEGWLSAAAFEEVEARGDSSPSAAWALLSLCRRRKLEASRPWLERYLRSEDPRLALAALEGLSAIGVGSSLEAVDEASRRPASPAPLRVAAALLLGGEDRGRPLERILALLEDGSWELRVAALEALPPFASDPRAFSSTVRRLDDPNREVRRAAYAALASFRRKEAIDAAITRLGKRSQDDLKQAVRCLEALTEERKGADPRAWRAWWERERERFEFPAGRRSGPPASPPTGSPAELPAEE